MHHMIRALLAISVTLLAACSKSGSGQAAHELDYLAGRLYTNGTGSVSDVMSLRIDDEPIDARTLSATFFFDGSREWAARIYRDEDPPFNAFTEEGIEDVLILELDTGGSIAWSWLAVREGGARLDNGLTALGGGYIFPPVPEYLPQNRYTATAFWQ
jgi:hypothetical protein